MNADESLILPAAILFDMDGTLTKPFFNFDQIKQDMGIGQGPILETMLKMSAADRVVAEKILHRHEDAAAEQATLNVGCMELLQWIEAAGIVTALVTRNTRRSVAIVFRRLGLHFDICITREDGKYKPDPEPLLLACQRLKVMTDRAWMVGDGYHDIEAGVAAQMRTVWISHGSTRTFAAEPSVTVNDLVELKRFLEKQHG